MTKKTSGEHVVLITNLHDVTIDMPCGMLRANANAIILLDAGDDSDGGPRYRVHGFRNEAANLVFDMVLPSFDWTIEPQSYKRAFTLGVAGKPPVRFTLHTNFTNDKPLDIQQWDVTEDNRGDWSDILMRKVLRYYYAPYFIIGQQVEADKARQALGVESVESGT